MEGLGGFEETLEQVIKEMKEMAANPTTMAANQIANKQDTPKESDFSMSRTNELLGQQGITVKYVIEAYRA